MKRYTLEFLTRRESHVGNRDIEFILAADHDNEIGALRHDIERLTAEVAKWKLAAPCSNYLDGCQYDDGCAEIECRHTSQTNPALDEMVRASEDAGAYDLSQTGPCQPCTHDELELIAGTRCMACKEIQVSSSRRLPLMKGVAP